MYDALRNSRINSFFVMLKTLYPEGVYGLALPKHAELLPGGNMLYNFILELFT